MYNTRRYTLFTGGAHQGFGAVKHSKFRGLSHRRRHGIKCGYAESEARRAESGEGLLGGAASPLGSEPLPTSWGSGGAL